MHLLLLFVAAFLSSLAAGALALAYARGARVLDVPGARSSHTRPTPRGGGAGFAAVLVGACLGAAWCVPAWRLAWGGSAIGLVLVASVGWLDDHRSVPARYRLLVHVLAAGCAAVGLQACGEGSAALVVIVAGPVLINFWNFMDGINGLSASQAALFGGASVLLGSGLAAPAGAVLAGAAAGFLPFNFPFARIFMGDVGSGTLGLAVAVVLALAATHSLQIVALLLCVPAFFLMDALCTLVLRMLRRERWWQAHAQHTYQVAARRDGHTRVTLLYAAGSLAFGALAYAAAQATPGRNGWWLLSICATIAALQWARLRCARPETA